MNTFPENRQVNSCLIPRDYYSIGSENNCSILSSDTDLSERVRDSLEDWVASYTTRGEPVLPANALKNNFRLIPDSKISKSDPIDGLKYDDVVEVINGIDNSIISQHKRENKLLLDSSLSNKKIVIKPSGKVYVCAGIIGRGNHKISQIGVCLGNLSNLNELGKTKKKLRAISIPYERNRFMEKEIKLNGYLRRMKKEHKELSHVNVTSSSIEDEILITELFDGDVNYLIEIKKMDLKQKYMVCFQMSQGIGELHEIGLVHRDCKPDNFLYKINEMNEVEKIVVNDFGLSGPMNELDDKGGTWIYLPFSECNNPRKTFAPTSDIFQLGISFLLIINDMTVEEWSKVMRCGVNKLAKERNLRLNQMKCSDQWKQEPEKWTDLKGRRIIEQIQDLEVKNFILRMISAEREIRPLHQEVTSFFQLKSQM